MPTYAYACKDCGHAFDIQQSFTDDSLTVCPECRGKLRKKFNSVGVVFKGSGFYRTDSRSTSSSVPAAASNDQTSAAKATSAAAGSTSSVSSSSVSAGSASGNKATKTPATAAS
ncbi:FmdB family zinc ribbon protein [Arthrobacter sp.]|uniref:FmdB family zinc ribbon protein n=1 Tax=Arthrobacter sp. TaxID=1667 RepID=UPI0026E03855|nr:FmdB family zinc ribbon protein [Arthrobacter sp.]MDO5754599.1 zinc ribbon domain-containing protein [Arthrobacter sp.]